MFLRPCQGGDIGCAGDGGASQVNNVHRTFGARGREINLKERRERKEQTQPRGLPEISRGQKRGRVCRPRNMESPKNIHPDRGDGWIGRMDMSGDDWDGWGGPPPRQGGRIDDGRLPGVLPPANVPRASGAWVACDVEIASPANVSRTSGALCARRGAQESAVNVDCGAGAQRCQSKWRIFGARPSTLDTFAPLGRGDGKLTARSAESAKNRLSPEGCRKLAGGKNAHAFAAPRTRNATKPFTPAGVRDRSTAGDRPIDFVVDSRTPIASPRA